MSNDKASIYIDTSGFDKACRNASLSVIEFKKAITKRKRWYNFLMFLNRKKS